MDHWDPALTDAFAQDREVILFNNAGISSSGGEVPASIEETARDAAAFTDTLGIKPRCPVFEHRDASCRTWLSFCKSKPQK